MTAGGNSCYHFPEIAPTREITTTTKKIFLSFSRPWPRAYFVNGANAAAATASTLIRRCPEDNAKHSQLISRRPPNSHRVFIQVCIKRETTPELSTDWVDPWVGSRFFSFW